MRATAMDCGGFPCQWISTANPDHLGIRDWRALLELVRGGRHLHRVLRLRRRVLPLRRIVVRLGSVGMWIRIRWLQRHALLRRRRSAVAATAAAAHTKRGVRMLECMWCRGSLQLLWSRGRVLSF